MSNEQVAPKALTKIAAAQALKCEITGYLNTIDKYKNLVFNLDQSSADLLLKLTADFEGHSPLQSYVGRDDKTYYSVKLKLSNWLKIDVNFKKAFENMIKKKCSFLVEIKNYDFENSQKEQVKGWTVNYINGKLL